MRQKISAFSQKSPIFAQQIKSDLQKNTEFHTSKQKRSIHIRFFVGLYICVWSFYSLHPVCSDSSITIASLDTIPIVVDEKLGSLSASQMDHGGVEIHGKNIVEPIEKKIRTKTTSVAQSNNASEGTFKIDVHVIRSDVENAYALPGGYIVIYTGLIESSSSPEEIAGVLAHGKWHM